MTCPDPERSIISLGLNVMLIQELDQPVGPDPKLTSCIRPVGHAVALHAQTERPARAAAIDRASEQIARQRVEELHEECGSAGVCDVRPRAPRSPDVRRRYMVTKIRLLSRDMNFPFGVLILKDCIPQFVAEKR